MHSNNHRSIGIIGGMSPESTVTYYQHIIKQHHIEFQDHSYPRLVIASVSFQRYINWQHKGTWKHIQTNLEQEFRSVAKAGADFAILATNTMHKVLPEIRSPIPVLTVFKAVADAARRAKVKTIGLTGTQFTMSDGFYEEELERQGFSVLLPHKREQESIHRIIYKELIAGRVNTTSVRAFERIAERLSDAGAECVLLACTELELLIRGRKSSIKFIDTTKEHALAAWEIAVGKESFSKLFK
ncbi:MAG: amino acid racemase [Ignavibacteriales bacterium]|nr:amino acid racemase [Ignavibacteriales bacterium]